MFDNVQSVPEDIQQFVPHDCTNAPANGKAFCLAHCSQLEEMGVPTGLREFIRFCGASTVNFNKDGKSKVKLQLAALAKRVKTVVGTSSAESQGVGNFLRNRDIANKEQLQELPLEGKEDCRKDVGEPLRLRRRSRGLLPFIAGLKYPSKYSDKLGRVGDSGCLMHHLLVVLRLKKVFKKNMMSLIFFQKIVTKSHRYGKPSHKTYGKKTDNV